MWAVSTWFHVCIEKGKQRTQRVGASSYFTSKVALTVQLAWAQKPAAELSVYNWYTQLVSLCCVWVAAWLLGAVPEAGFLHTHCPSWSCQGRGRKRGWETGRKGLSNPGAPANRGLSGHCLGLVDSTLSPRPQNNQNKRKENTHTLFRKMPVSPWEQVRFKNNIRESQQQPPWVSSWHHVFNRLGISEAGETSYYKSLTSSHWGHRSLVCNSCGGCQAVSSTQRAELHSFLKYF